MLCLCHNAKEVNMNKQEIYEFLKKEGVWYEIDEHEAVYNMSELSEVRLSYPEYDAKNLFVRDDKRRSYYLITVKGDKRVDLKEFRRSQGTKPLTFANADDLMSILGLIPGAVTPLGLLNDTEHRVKFFLDREFLDGQAIIGVHPNDNTATVWLKTADLLTILEKNQTEVATVEL